MPSTNICTKETERRESTGGEPSQEKTSDRQRDISGEPSQQYVESMGSTRGGEESISWPDKIERALKARGGEATGSEILHFIKEHYPKDIENRKNWENSVRACLSNNRRFARGDVKSGSKLLRWRLSPVNSISWQIPPSWRAGVERESKSPERDSDSTTWSDKIYHVLKYNGGQVGLYCHLSIPHMAILTVCRRAQLRRYVSG